jgi:hypothetical protein
VLPLRLTFILNARVEKEACKQSVCVLTPVGGPWIKTKEKLDAMLDQATVNSFPNRTDSSFHPLKIKYTRTSGNHFRQKSKTLSKSQFLLLKVIKRLHLCLLFIALIFFSV